MKFSRRRPTDADLVSWLTTGKPARVDKLIDDPDVTDRLERITALPTGDIAAIEAAVTPSEGFVARTEAGVHLRVSDLERAGALLGLLGLGAQTMRTLSAPDDFLR